MAGKSKRVIAPGVYVYVRPEKGGLDDVLFKEGDEVPDWAAKQMGDHCFADGGDAGTTAPASAPTSTPATNENKGEDSGAGTAADYKPLGVKDLKAEIAKRNEGRDEDDLIEVEAPGNKPELIAALQADDVAQADKADDDAEA